jgi:hypothetical protein
MCANLHESISDIEIDSIFGGHYEILFITLPCFNVCFTQLRPMYVPFHSNSRV